MPTGADFVHSLLMHGFRGLGSGLVVRAAHGAPFMHGVHDPARIGPERATGGRQSTNFMHGMHDGSGGGLPHPSPGEAA